MSAPLLLEAPDCLRADSFCERREVGIVNLGGAGSVRVGDTRHGLGAFDFLYVGRGSGDIVFEPGKGKEPAPLYYLVSYPAHRACGTSRHSFAREAGRSVGEKVRCNERNLHPMIAPDNVESCQLVMGVTFLKEGNVWNTMPPHTHLRRSEIYFYFDIREDALVFHFMGKPEETRHIVVRNQQAVLSPSWSIHSGAGTANYGFVWAMGGENQEFGDMDAVDPSKME
ncbi:MAG: 5-dehydro-4-deoxy-D-glucuronate isomerase [Opitutales bacterium]|nr:5-dehydro-4-deoxy-D-glucuronate isomerase [Opitutales bacterium]